MPPKRGNLVSNSKRSTSLNSSSSNNSFNNASSTTSKNTSIMNMFKRIETNDGNLVKCEYCKLQIKSCLLNDHMSTKCEIRKSLSEKTRRERDEDISGIIFVCEKKQDEDNYENDNKRLKINSIKDEVKISSCNVATDSINNFNSLHSTPKKLKINNIEATSVLTVIKNENQTPIKKSPVTTPEKVENTVKENTNVDTKAIETDKQAENNENQNKEVQKKAKITEIQESNLQQTPNSKLNFARKSTYCKYVKNKKENLNTYDAQNCLKDDCLGSTSTEEVLKKLDEEGYFNDIDIDKFNDKNLDSLNGDADFKGSSPKTNICYALKNFINAIETVFEQNHFTYLLNKHDLDIIDKFYNLTDECKKLYVRLFHRKHRWIQVSNMNYENISSNIVPYLEELEINNFLINENTIDTYEEIIDLLKLPQLKQLVKQYRIGAGQTLSKLNDYKIAILKHFKTQKGLNFFKSQKSVDETSNQLKSNYMSYCKNLLGKCFKLDKNARDVFVRVLMLYSLSSTHHVDHLDSGQQQLFQILMVNLGKLKFMNYDIALDIKIYSDREDLINYQNALEYEFELLDLIEKKELETAFDEFDMKIYSLKTSILNENLLKNDSKLPNYLRKFSANSIYCKIMSIYASEVLQKMKQYKKANELFEFLLYKQELYLLDSRHHWYERLAINYETHLKEPDTAMDTLKKGLEDKVNVRKAGRLSLYQRAVKMTQTKRYSKYGSQIEKLSILCENDKYNISEAPIRTIEANILEQIIPGRKTIFMQENSIRSTASQTSSESQATSNVDICSVEQIALTYYMKNDGYTHGKHAETSSIMTIFGLIFWDILFKNQVSNVFVDKFQTAPLDLNTDYFYMNRKESIDTRVNELKTNNIDYIINLVEINWQQYLGTECSLVNWNLFEDFEELKGLLMCFSNENLASLCGYIAQNYRYCRSGGPDLIIWSIMNKQVIFVEVKGPGDKLSYKQIVWLDFLMRSSIKCEVCYVKGVCSKRLRECD